MDPVVETLCAGEETFNLARNKGFYSIQNTDGF